jgi:hypothetical protein
MDQPELGKFRSEAAAIERLIDRLIKRSSHQGLGATAEALCDAKRICILQRLGTYSAAKRDPRWVREYEQWLKSDDGPAAQSGPGERSH